jgi:uracil-DNA glycosylase family 4
MGGSGIAADMRDTESALRWWLEAGVDVAVQEEPRDWLSPSPVLPAVDVPETAAPPPPATLEEFRQWLTGRDAPLASGSKPVLPQGARGAEVMLLAEPPTRDELGSGTPIGGEAAELMKRMLAAIGLQDSAYSANLACFHSPSARLSASELEKCAAAALRHVALAAPKRLLLLGDAPCRAVLGKALLEARGHVHKVEGVRTIATFHPRQLLKRPSDKALAWKDLLLLMEEPV